MYSLRRLGAPGDGRARSADVHEPVLDSVRDVDLPHLPAATRSAKVDAVWQLAARQFEHKPAIHPLAWVEALEFK